MEEKACVSMGSSTKKSEAGEGVSSIQKTFSWALCLYKDCLCLSHTVGEKWTSEFQPKSKLMGLPFGKTRLPFLFFKKDNTSSLSV